MHDVIIIGAGASGLAAARAMADAGRHALVVEARDRAGGRIWTDHSHGPVELGAEFVHGDRAITWELVHAAGLRLAPWGADRRFARGGRVLAADDPTIARVYELYDAVARYEGPDVSVAELLATRAPAGDPALAIALRWLANLEGADPARLSAAAFGYERASSTNGEGNFHILDGYDRLVAHLAAGLDLRLGSPVERVAWGEAGAAVELAGGETLEARRVLVTLPVGVLKAGRPAFAPALPPAKAAAIAAIPMGQVTKLAMWFDRRLWPTFTALSTDGQIATWWPVESAATPTLMGYQGGPQAVAVAAMGEERAIAAGLDDLAALFGPEVRRAFLGGRLADWSRDPWSCGAYTYSAVGMGAARAALAEPVAGTLFFAGEAVAQGGHIATVHGAIESGRRAAAAILAEAGA
ncbi:MAG TPA: NAD(P)/FAD-dependent oxidoreductase [Chloroflexaceae bacterium]|nr:NAD(P)/FAD-dependent oxidoreductase [Chloroflexaceae bacterium]